jgi:hypothetical protein
MSYEELKAERNRLKALLDNSPKSIRNGTAHKAVEKKYQDYCTQIKQLFRK